MDSESQQLTTTLLTIFFVFHLFGLTLNIITGNKVAILSYVIIAIPFIMIALGMSGS